MVQTLIVATLLLHALLTAGAIAVWKKVKVADSKKLPMVFIATAVVRMLSSLTLFVVAVVLLREIVGELKLFTIIFLAVYLLLLAFDTLYFYFSSRQTGK